MSEATKYQIQIQKPAATKWQTTRTFGSQQTAEAAAAKVRIATWAEGWKVRVIQKV